MQALKNGFYTFNAATNTTRVLKGEANAFVGANQDVKPIKVKEDHAVTFPTASAAVAKARSADFYPYEARTDIIPAPGDAARSTDGQRYGEGFQGYGYGYPGYGFYGYGYPYYAWDYPLLRLRLPVRLWPGLRLRLGWRVLRRRLRRWVSQETVVIRRRRITADRVS